MSFEATRGDELIREVTAELGVEVAEFDGTMLTKHWDFPGFVLFVVTGAHRAVIPVSIPLKHLESQDKFKSALERALWVWRTK